MNHRKMKNVMWIVLNCAFIFHLITTTYAIGNDDDLVVYLDSSNSSAQEKSDSPALDVEQTTNTNNDEFDELEETIDEASSDIVESQVPFPTDKPLEIDSEVPIRRPRRKRRRRRKRPRTSTYTYDGDINQPIRYQEPQEPDYSEGYVRRRPIKRRRRPMYRRPIINGSSEDENILPRRKLIRRPAGYYLNKTRNEDVKQWEPITTTEETKWKPVKPTTTETTNTVSTTTTPKSTSVTTPSPAITTTSKTNTVITTFSTQTFLEENNKINHRDAGLTKKSNSSRADMVVLHKRPINSNLPPTSAVIRRRIKPKNTTTESNTFKPKMIVIQEELPLSLLPPGFIKSTEEASAKESTNNTKDYRFNDEALTKITKEQTNHKNNDFKFKSVVDSPAKEFMNNTEYNRFNNEASTEIVKEQLNNKKNDFRFKSAEDAPTKELINNNTDDYRFNDEALTKIMKEQSNYKNNDLKFKSDSIPKVKDEILSLLKTKTGSLLLSNILYLRNMSLEELLQHRERGSSQRHQELIDAKEEQIQEEISSGEPIIVTENTKNFTNFLIETKHLAQNNKDTQIIEKANEFILSTENNKELKKQNTQTSIADENSNEENQNEQEVNRFTEQIPQLKQHKHIDNNKSNISIQVSKEENHGHKDTGVFKSSTIEPLNNVNIEKNEQENELFKIQLDSIFEEKKVFSFPTTTTYTTKNENNKENEATSFVSKTPKTRIVLETLEREPRLFDSMPDFTLKTTLRPLITPTIPSQVLFIQDTNHLDKYQSNGEKTIDEDNNLIYRRFEMRKLPVGVKSAIIASAAILAIAVLGFFVLLISCRMRQKKQMLRKKSSVFCQHNIHHDPDLRSSARSTSPVMDKHCHEQYYDGYGGHIDAQTTANRQYYLWRTLRKTFRYD